jgi:putative membrane protein
MVIHRLSLVATLGLLATVSQGAVEDARVLAASANPTFANPDTPGLPAGKPAPDVANTSDIVFLKTLANGSRAEVELGRLAAEKSSTSGVDRFGDHMVKDHSSANSKLAGLARSSRVELPKELDAAHEAARGELQRLSGRAFDLRYAESQIKDHQKAVQLLVYVIGSGQHAGVRQFAVDTLPVVMGHLEMARVLHAELVALPPE